LQDIRRHFWTRCPLSGEIPGAITTLQFLSVGENKTTMRLKKNRNSNISAKRLLAYCFMIFLLMICSGIRAGNLDAVGVTLLRQVDPTLLGTGVPVAQVEAPEGTGSPEPFEVNPSIVGQPASLFTWISSAGTATTFPNSVGANSGHANAVAGNFYAAATGVAPQVAHVDNYEANFFWTSIVIPGTAMSTQSRSINQSFVFSNPDGSHLSTNDEQSVESLYDDYGAQYNVLFISGAGNGGRVYPPSSCYNGIGVGVFPGSSSFGPTPDGRSKPDITSPGSGVTSYSTPFVSGSAALLMQAANRGDGGANINAAVNSRTIKALLLNGAIKPSNWTNGPTTPLDARYGAGILNVFNSWQQLKGGRRQFIESTLTASSGGPHPPGANTNNEPTLNGWDSNIVTSVSSQDRVNHYYFNLPGSNTYTLTTTLTWNRQANQTSINNLNLYLYNMSNTNLVACSTSLVDNVEHLFVTSLPPGRYDLQVLKLGNTPTLGENYALAFEFFNLNLKLNLTNTNTIISWPIYPTGFRLEATTNLAPPVSWASVSAPVFVDTNSSQNLVTVPISETNQFFRLQRP
jgi:hypothetical protein